MIDLTKPVRHRATKKLVEATIEVVKVPECFVVRVSGMTKYPLTFTNEEFEQNYENVPEPREWSLHFHDSGMVEAILPPRIPCSDCVRVREVIE